MIPNDPINEHLIEIDITSPKDLYEKLDICFDKPKIASMTQINFEYYELVCNEENFKINYEKMFDEFSYLINRWK